MASEDQDLELVHFFQDPLLCRFPPQERERSGEGGPRPRQLPLRGRQALKMRKQAAIERRIANQQSRGDRLRGTAHGLDEPGKAGSHRDQVGLDQELPGSGIAQPCKGDFVQNPVWDKRNSLARWQPIDPWRDENTVKLGRQLDRLLRVLPPERLDKSFHQVFDPEGSIRMLNDGDPPLVNRPRQETISKECVFNHEPVIRQAVQGKRELKLRLSLKGPRTFESFQRRPRLALIHPLGKDHFIIHVLHGLGVGEP